MRALLLATALMGCAAPPAPVVDTPDPVEVRARIDKAVATTGDLLTYTVEVEREPDIDVRIPEAGAEIAGFRIIDVGTEQETRPDGRLVDSRWYALRADLIGSYVLPPASVDVKLPEAEDWAALEASAIFVEVESVLPEDGTATDIRDLKALAPRPASPWWPYAAAAGGGLLALALAAAAWRRWGRRLLEPTPPPPPHEVAFRALDALRATDFADLDAVREYYFSISSVLRTYVEDRFGLRATDLTSEEIRARINHLGVEAAQRDQLDRFLEHTDAVKYAARAPGQADIETVYEAALGFVEATVPRPAPTDQDEDPPASEEPPTSEAPPTGSAPVDTEPDEVTA